MPRQAPLIRSEPGFGQPRQDRPPHSVPGIAALPLAALLLAVWPAPARAAGPIELVSADPGGVTLRLTVAPYDLGPPDEGGRRELVIERLDLFDVPGRPRLPYATTMIAVPPGARAVATVLEGPEEVVEGVRLTIGDRPVLRSDREGTEYIAMREPVDPIQDGAWPRSAVEVGEPYTVRRQRVAVVQIQPYRYDVTDARLWTRRTLTVRVRFEGGSAAAVPAAPAAEDRGWEPLLRGTVANYEQGRRWREPRPALSRGLFDRTTGTRAGAPGALGVPAFDENEPEVRVRIAETGAWALEAAELFAKGYPAGVPIAEVSVHRHEWVPNIQAPNPPYVTIEIPIEVDDADGDLSFSDGDRIVLYAQSWWQRSGLAYQLPISHAQRLWGEADYVYATRVRAPRAGLRIPERSGWNDLTLTPLTSYRHYQRFEQNQVYLSAPRDTSQDAYQWIQRPLYASPTELPFEITNLDTTVRASVGATWTGLLNSYSHFVWAQVRNAAGQTTTVVDSAFASGKVVVTRSSTIFGSALSNGTANRLRIWGKRSNAPIGPENRYPDIALGYFDITYGRAYRAIQGYLACNNGPALGDYEIFATGFTDSASLRVYDVTDSIAVQRLSAVRKEPDAGGYGVRFQDNAAGSRRYVVFDAPKRPAAADYGAVDRAALTNLYARGTGDYLLIVPEAFQGAVGPLATLRTSQGLDVIVAPLGAVNDAFNGGRRSPWAIKRFIQYAYANWDARFVLLVGDGSQDPLLVSPFSSKDWVPTQRILGPVLASGPEESFLEAIVSDAWYVWCVECGSSLSPKVPDLHIGRLPVNSLAEASAVVNKLVSYESTPGDAWRRKMVLVSDDMYSGANTFGGDIPQIGYCRRRDERVFQTINERCRSIVLDEAGLRQSDPEIFNLSYYVPTYPSDLTCAQPAPPDTCRCAQDMTDNIYISRARSYAQPALFSRLAEGRLWFNYQGHANERVLAHEAFYSNGYGRLGDDKGLLANNGRPFIFTAFSCHPNAFGHFQEGAATRGGPALGEDLVNLPTTGAIASWGSAGFELLPTSSSRHINVEFARALFVDLPRNPKEFDGEGGARAVLGEVISYATIVYNQPGHLPTGSPYERDVGISYNLLGDPATRVTVGSPQSIFLANQTPVVDEVPVRLHTIGDTLRIEGDVASNARLDTVWVERIEGGSSSVVPPGDYTLTPAFPDTTIASGGGRRYHLLYRTLLVPRSHTYRIHSLDRYGTPGRLDAVFQLQSTLLAEGGVVSDHDLLAPTAQLSLLLISPSPLVPANDLRLTLNGANVNYTATPANNDVSGREWTLALIHDPFLAGDYRLDVSVQSVVQASHLFRIHTELSLDNAMAFPNPFNDQSGAAFSYYLGGDRPANVRLRVFTITGRLIFEREFPSLPVGYHQFHWNGTDAEGRSLANGVYFYRLAADNGGSSSRYEGRLVKLAKPTVVPEEVVP